MLSSIFLSKAMFGSCFAPMGFYGMLWGGNLILYHTNIISYPPLSLKTLIAIGISYLSFSIGCVAIWSANNAVKRGRNLICRKEISYRNTKRIKAFLLWGSIISLVGASMYLYMMVHYFSLGDFISSAAINRNFVSGRSAEVGKNWVLLYVPLGINYAVAALAGVYFTVVSSRRICVYLPLISIVIYSIAEFSRARIIDILFVFVVSYFFSNKFLKPKRISSNKTPSKKVIVSLVVLLIAIMIFIGGLLGKNKGEVEMANIPLPGVIVHLFYRLTSPLAVLDWKIQNHSGAFLWGDATFNVLKRILYAIGILDTYNMVAFYERNPLTGWTGYVTPSYLIWFYVDFGLIGTFVMPLLLGVVLSILYTWLRRKPSFYSIAMVSLSYLIILTSFGTWRLWDTYYVIAILSLIVIAPFIRVSTLRQSLVGL
jgi:oligosaccharide repeat unit polymerase